MVGKSALFFVSCGFGISVPLDDEDASSYVSQSQAYETDHLTLPADDEEGMLQIVGSATRFKATHAHDHGMHGTDDPFDLEPPDDDLPGLEDPLDSELLGIADNVTVDADSMLSGTCTEYGKGYIAGYQPHGGNHNNQCVTKQECFQRCASFFGCKAVDMGENQARCGTSKVLCNIRDCDPAADSQCASAITHPSWGTVYSCPDANSQMMESVCQTMKKFPQEGYGHIDYPLSEQDPWHWKQNKLQFKDCMTKCRTTPGCKSIDWYEDAYNGNRGGDPIRSCNLRNCIPGEAGCIVAKPAKWQLAGADCDADAECKGKRFTVYSVPECDYVPGPKRHTCPDGYTEVTTEAECEAAQDALILRTRAKTGGGRWYAAWTGTKATSWQHGCFWFKGLEENFAIFFNRGVDGTYPVSRPMCKKNPPTPAPTPEPVPEPSPAGEVKWVMLSRQTQVTLESQRHDGTAKCDAFCSSMGMECTEDVNLGDWKPAADGTLKYATEQGEATCDTARTWGNNLYPSVDLSDNECQYVEGYNARPASQRMFCRLNIGAGSLCPCQQAPAQVVWTALSPQTESSLQQQAGNTRSVSCDALCSSMRMGCQDNWNTGDWKPAADGSLKFTIHNEDQDPTVTSCEEVRDGGSSNFYPYADMGTGYNGQPANGVVQCTYITASWFARTVSCSKGFSVGNLCPCLLTAEALEVYPQLQEAR